MLSLIKPLAYKDETFIKTITFSFLFQNTGKLNCYSYTLYEELKNTKKKGMGDKLWKM